MGRGPCCDQDGVKKGPWTPEEDHLLVQYIQKNGFGRWHSLPKKAGFTFVFVSHLLVYSASKFKIY
jgi:hypothetical protein